MESSFMLIYLFSNRINLHIYRYSCESIFLKKKPFNFTKFNIFELWIFLCMRYRTIM